MGPRIDIGDGRIDGWDASTYFMREVGPPVFFLIPYGVWRLVAQADYSWDTAILIVGPVVSWVSVMCYGIAVRGVRQLPGIVPKVAPLFAWPFLIYLFAYKGVWGFVEALRDFSVIGLLAASFFTWLAYGPLKALSILQRHEVVRALQRSGQLSSLG